MSVVDGITRIEQAWSKCVKCKIGKFAHRHVVGTGSRDAKVLFVGEGPGVSEDALGEPFIGASGQLLREALDFAGFKEDDYFLTNLVACRPCDKIGGGNRAPSREEVSNCRGRLEGIYDYLRPKIVVPVGAIPAKYIEEWHSQWHIKPISHPSYVLRNGGRKAEMYSKWLQSIKRIREGL